MRMERLPTRYVCVVRHDGTLDTIDVTRRPLYRHMIMGELVGGPSIVRFHAGGGLEALVVTHQDFQGDEVCTVDSLPGGTYAVQDYHGPVSGLAHARESFVAEAASRGATGPLLQVHLMDEIDEETEQQFQMLVAKA